MRTRERVLLATLAVAGLTTTSVLISTTATAATIEVSTSAQLTQALASVQPGDTIQLAANTIFKGTFQATKNGTSAKRITLTGPRSAVIDGTGGGRTLELTGGYWTITGLRITGVQKGLMALGLHNTEVKSVKVDRVGHEAIHVQYVQVDRSDRNKALNSKFGPDVRAEAIDVKEGTTRGELSGNTFDGTGMSGVHSADSWIDLKRNGYKIAGNVGHMISAASSNPSSNGNKFYASNKVTNAGKGFSSNTEVSGC
jgi:hypothetical protein